MKKILLAALAFGVLSFSSCDSAQNNTTEGENTTETGTVSDETTADTATGTTTDATAGNQEAAEFMMMAANSNMMEIATGKLAAEKATNQEVKQFGQMMTTDHSSATQELKTLAASKNVTLPATMDADMQKKHDDLAKLSGAEFDKEYMNLMVKAHEKDVNMFTDASKDMADADTKAFAAKTLPVLQAHLDQAKKIDSNLKKK